MTTEEKLKDLLVRTRRDLNLDVIAMILSISVSFILALFSLHFWVNLALIVTAGVSAMAVSDGASVYELQKILGGGD